MKYYRHSVWLMSLICAVWIFNHVQFRKGLDIKPIIKNKTPYSYSEFQDVNSSLEVALKNRQLGQDVNPEIMEFVLDGSLQNLKRSPLSSDALQAIVLAEFVTTGHIKNIPMVEEALSRNGRNRSALRSLLMMNLQNNNVSQALENIEDLFRLDPDKYEYFTQILKAIYQSEEHRGVLLKNLSVSPNWSYRFLVETLPVLRPEDVEDWDTVLRKIVHTDRLRVGDFIQKVYANKLISFGMYEKAYDFWLNSHPDQDRSTHSEFLFNSDFQSVDAYAPFNWVLKNNDQISLEYELDGGLFISFKSNKKTLLLSQYTPYSTNVRQLAFDYNFKSDDDAGYFEWEFRCVESAELLFAYRFDESTAHQNGTYNEIPRPLNNCKFVKAELYGIPGRYPKRQTLTIQSIRIN